MTKTNLNMDTLRTFVTGVRLGNFSKAAMRIGRSQSAISLQIRRLEQQVGVQLFSRDGRSLTLSEAGKTLYGYAERMIDLNDEAMETVAKKEVEGEIRLGIPPDLAETWLPHMLARFSRSHPGVSMEAHVDRNASLMEDISAKRAWTSRWCGTEALPARQRASRSRSCRSSGSRPMAPPSRPRKNFRWW